MWHVTAIILVICSLSPVSFAQDKPVLSGKTGGASAPVKSASDKPAPITGQVTDDGGSPIADVSVMALPVGFSGSQGITGLIKMRWTFTDEVGEFIIEDLPSGPYNLILSCPGYVSAMNPGQPEPKYYRPGDKAALKLIRSSVITGSVSNNAAEPVVGIRVQAVLIRGLDGRTTPSRNVTNALGELAMPEAKTDDRGVYRMWGLMPGIYIVYVGGGSNTIVPQSVTGYERMTPTYYPSATSRAEAVEVTVQAGGETSGIDIRYQRKSGWAIAGTVSGSKSESSSKSNLGAAVLTLTEASSGTEYGTTTGIFTEGSARFAFNAVADGEYFLTAVGGLGSDQTAVSAPYKVVVRGADVTGMNLMLEPLGSINARVVMEKALDGKEPICEKIPTNSIRETVLHAWLDEKGKDKADSALKLPSFGAFYNGSEAATDEKGDVKIRWLKKGRYRLEAIIPSNYFFVRSIDLVANTSKSAINVARDGILLGAAEHKTGLIVALAQGAAAITGMVVPTRKGAPLPPRLSVHLTPTESDSIDDVLRYRETVVHADGSFSFSNLAPGSYRLLALPITEEEMKVRRPAAWETDLRRKLRREAEARAPLVDLRPCQQLNNYIIRYEFR